MEVAALPEVGDVALRSGGEVVENEHLGALVEQELGQVRSDEAGPTRYERAAQGTAMVATEAAIMGP